MTSSRSHVFLRYTRLVHLYLGVFTAPALIFFAFTGALQTFGLHEMTRGSAYKPPAWVASLAQLHKKQTPVVPVRKAPAPEKLSDPASSQIRQPADSATPAATLPARQHHSMPMKIFFMLVAVGLFTSTISGIYMSYKYIRNRVWVTVLLALGTAIPVVLALI